MKPSLESERKLVRAVGLKEIIALTINGIIGAGIFAIPATIGKTLGMSSPIAFVIAGFFCANIVLCFAELGGRYDRTGGAYLYAHEAFGELTAFLIGWMYFLARLTSTAALSNTLAGFLSYFMDVDILLRSTVIVTLLLLLGLINYSGIRSSSRVINFLTIAKLVPLLIFIVGGLSLVEWKAFAQAPFPPAKPLSEALLLAMFAFSGFEVIAIPGAEMINPKRNLPLGILIGTAVTIVVYLLIQVVAVATHPGLADSLSPLAEAAERFLGKKGGTLLTVGAFCSTLGTLTSLLLVGPRILYAMALNRQMPEIFSRVHERFRTPHVAILFTTVLGIVIALSGTFTTLATLSAMARLMTYIGAAVALWVLRRRQASPDTFRAPGGFVIPLLTVLLSLFLLSAATLTHWISGSLALLVGLLLYLAGATSKFRR